jgi:hypothetical protein
MRARDTNFFAGAAAHNSRQGLAQFTCCAVVRGKRCGRITIIETQHRHCIKHAGPAAARAYRENCRKLFESGRYPAAKWFKDEARRARTAIRDRQRRKHDGWRLPGVTLRFADPLEVNFRADISVLLRAPWSEVPDYFRDQLRWAWRRFVLDRQKPDAWGAKGRAILLDLGARGPFEGDTLEHATGHEPHVLCVDRRATAFEWRARLSNEDVNRALGSVATMRRAIAQRHATEQGVPVKTVRKPAPVDEAELERLLLLHGRDLRTVLARVPEAAWPTLLAAYDAYVVDPTATTHRRWAAALKIAS